MMKIECVRCAELVETSARQVKAPFLCDECKKAPAKIAAMAPAPLHVGGLPAVAGDCPTDCGCRVTRPSDDVCDTASVEATTELIEQLEADKQELMQRLTDDSHLIDDLSTKLNASLDEQNLLMETMKKDRAEYNRIIHEVVAKKDEYAGQAEDLGKKNSGLNGLLAHLLKKSFEIFCAKEDAEAGENAAIALLEKNIEVMDRAYNEIVRLRSNNEGLESDLAQAKHEATRYNGYWHEACARADRYRDEKTKLEARGLVARVFNSKAE